LDTVEIARALSFDAMALTITLAVAFNLGLLLTGKYREFLVFNIGGAINIALELGMIASGSRHFDTNDFLLQTAAILCLAWVTNGFLCTVAYINVKHWMKRAYTTRFVVAANGAFFLGLPLALFPFEFFQGAVTVWRDAPAVTAFVEPLLFAGLATAIFLLGYRKLLWRMALIGFAIDLHFETTLLLFGIRDAQAFEWLPFLSRVFFEMNIFLCIGFLILKAIYGLNDYKEVLR
jgi:hypothetical protein